MSIRDAVYSRLSGYAGLTALTTAIYTRNVPQDTSYPCVFFEVVNMDRISAINGDSGTVDTNIRVISMGSTLTSAVSVADQVRAALQRWSGTSASVTVINIFIDDESDSYDDDLGVAHIEQSFTISHKE